MSGTPRWARTAREFLFPSAAEDRSIPVLDGGLSPNDQLDTFEETWSQPDGEPDSLLVTDRGLVVGSGSTLTALAADGFQAGPRLEVGGRIGALVALPDGVILAIVAGGPSRYVRWGTDGALELAGEAGLTVACPTDATVVGRTVYISEGSVDHAVEEWMFDLMLKGASGRVLAFDLDSGDQRVVASGLAWANGVEAATGDGRLVVSEAWRHRLVEINVADGTVTPIGQRLPAYPGRLSKTPSGALLLAFLSLRTHLVELVLREDEYRSRMVETIDPQFWIRPALRVSNTQWEPLQIGSMKRLGITKPWAPPRAYGLVALVDADGIAARSWQGRVGSPRTGITAAAVDRGHLVVVSRGGRCVLRSPLEEIS